MDIRTSFEQAMRSFGISPGSAPVFLAISGGVDSVVLAHLLKQSGYNPTWLHVNFQLRGEESERDQQFVEALAQAWEQNLQVKTADAASYADQYACSIQEAARKIRYDWFSEMVRTEGPTAILLTAHQADDNTETLLMNFLRGTGIKGLTGIPSINDYIRRPFLQATRSSIEQYANENRISFVEDSSNLSTDYTRNQLRLEVMPLLRQLYPQVDHSLSQNIERFRSIFQVYKEASNRWIRKYVKVEKEGQRVSVALLLHSENRAILHEWLSDYGFTEKQERELIRLGESQSGHFIVSADGRYRILKHRKHFILSPLKESGVQEHWISEEDQRIRYAGGELQLKKSDPFPDSLPDKAAIAVLDAAELTFPLLLRQWRAGDYFYPLGLNKKKKIARFLIDQKLSGFDKEKVWVIESAGRIVWVIGQRIDHRFRVIGSTRQVIRLESVG